MELPFPTDHTDLVTYVGNPEDVHYLKTPLHDVSIRLMGTNAWYGALVLSACAYLERACLTKLPGYKLPHGMSGANLGIPWNIIAVAVDRDTPKAAALIMINPKITAYLGETVISESNCGSIRLKEPIQVKRHESVDVSWWDTDGVAHARHFTRAEGSLTIQHEVDHNLAITILDRRAPPPAPPSKVYGQILCGTWSFLPRFPFVYPRQLRELDERGEVEWKLHLAIDHPGRLTKDALWPYVGGVAGEYDEEQ